jgi:hypothetical protein
LPQGRVDLKRRDALEMLAAMRTFLDTSQAPKQVTYDFAHTTLWDNAVAASESEDKGLSSAENAAWDELRVGPEAGEAPQRAGLWRMLALQECDRRGIEVSTRERRQAAAQFRRQRGLATAEQLQRWLVGNHLDRNGFDCLMDDEARLDKLQAALGSAAASARLDHARASGRYAHLAARAADKDRSLAASPVAASTPGAAALLQALVWYFEDRLGCEMPPDMEAYARSASYADATSFRQAVWREYLYFRLSDVPPAVGGGAG